MKLTKSINILSLLLLIALSSSGFAASNSGFLDDYSGLKADPDRTGAKVYRKAGVSLGAYDKIMITPIEIWYHPKTKYKGVSPEEMKVFADTFAGILMKELEPDYPVVNATGKGVLVVRLAITDMKMKKKKRGLLGYTPIGAGITLLKDAAGARIKLSDALIEAELVDGETGEKLGMLVDDIPKSVNKDEKLSWESVEKALTFYAKRFRARLDAEH
jgi:Protein of unknown function (DUF3313)